MTFPIFVIYNMVQPDNSSTINMRGGLFQIASCLLIFLTLVSCGAGRNTVSHAKNSSTTSTDILSYANKYLGKRYRSGGKGPKYFDCSGYTSFVYGAFGYKLGSSSTDQEKTVPHINDRKKLQEGDLVFFEGRKKNGKVGHVGIVTNISSNGDFEFIHASTTSGVIISSSKEPFYASRYLRGGRVLEKSTTIQQTTLTASVTSKKSSKLRGFIARSIELPIININRENERDSVSIESSQINNKLQRDSVTFLKTDSTNNQPEEQKPQDQTSKNGKKDIDQPNTDIILREDEFLPPTPTTFHTVKIGETLYSISKLYGCTIEQLKSMNLHLGDIIKTGEVLHIPVTL